MNDISFTREYGPGRRAALRWTLFSVLPVSRPAARLTPGSRVPARSASARPVVDLDRVVAAARFGVVALAEGDRAGEDRRGDRP